MTLWRGAKLTCGRGLSWTLHREVAVGFAHAARNFGTPVGIFLATVPGRAILAAFGGSDLTEEGEQELVVNPFMLGGRIVLEEELGQVAARPVG